MNLYDLDRNFKTIEAVKCTECGMTHEVNDPTYITIYGNICVGRRGGILGGGNWEEHGVPVYVMCPECLTEFIRNEMI